MIKLPYKKKHRELPLGSTFQMFMLPLKLHNNRKILEDPEI